MPAWKRERPYSIVGSNPSVLAASFNHTSKLLQRREFPGGVDIGDITDYPIPSRWERTSQVAARAKAS